MIRIRTNTRIRTDVLGVSAISPLNIVTSRTPFFFLSADVGTTIATGVSNWVDQTSNGHTATQGTAANQPALVVGDTDFGGRNSLLADGSNDFLDVSWDAPAPGTQPIWIFSIFLQVSWTISDFIWAGSTAASVLALFQTGSTPSLTMANTNTVNANTGAAIGSAVRAQVYYSASTSDYTKLGSTVVTGASSGTSDPAVFRLFSRNGSSQSSNVKMACIGAWAGEPNAGEKAALDTWVQAYYGAGIVI